MENFPPLPFLRNRRRKEREREEEKAAEKEQIVNPTLFPAMVAPNLKAETISLMDRRAEIESQMNTIIERLSQPGGPGISGNLLDSEGFPRSDIDIPVIRADRSRLSVLRNHHRDLTKKIDHNIQVLHSGKVSQNAATLQTQPDTISSSSSQYPVIPTDVDLSGKIPFALVDEISEGSPASDDGMQLGDQIVKFGNVEAGDQLVSRLATEAQTNNGSPVPIEIMRQGTLINISVTPRQWHGRGLLGCHFKIL